MKGNGKMTKHQIMTKMPEAQKKIEDLKLEVMQLSFEAQKTVKQVLKRKIVFNNKKKGGSKWNINLL